MPTSVIHNGSDPSRPELGSSPSILTVPLADLLRSDHRGFDHAARDAIAARCGLPMMNQRPLMTQGGRRRIDVAVPLQEKSASREIVRNSSIERRECDSSVYRAEADVQEAQTAVTRVPATRVTDLVGLIRAEYNEMPGLCLTRAQAQRLWLLEADVCDNVLRAMVDAGFLRLTSGGYVRG